MVEGPFIIETADRRNKNLKYDLRIGEALNIKRYNCGPGKGMNEDFGSYVTTTQWQPVFNKLGRWPEGGQGVSPSFGFDHVQIWAYVESFALSLNPQLSFPHPRSPLCPSSPLNSVSLSSFPFHQWIKAILYLPKYLVSVLTHLHMYHPVNKLMFSTFQMWNPYWITWKIDRIMK